MKRNTTFPLWSHGDYEKNGQLRWRQTDHEETQLDKQKGRHAEHVCQREHHGICLRMKQKEEHCSGCKLFFF